MCPCLTSQFLWSIHCCAICSHLHLNASAGFVSSCNSAPPCSHLAYNVRLPWPVVHYSTAGRPPEYSARSCSCLKLPGQDFTCGLTDQVPLHVRHTTCGERFTKSSYWHKVEPRLAEWIMGSVWIESLCKHAMSVFSTMLVFSCSQILLVSCLTRSDFCGARLNTAHVTQRGSGRGGARLSI